MQDKVIYEYAIIRLVPLVQREEFINIGVILYSKKKGYLGMKYLIDESRARLFKQDIDIEAINSYLDGWMAVCEGSDNGGAIGQLDKGNRFRWLVAARSTIIQASKTHPGLSDHPESTLVKLFEEMVL